MKVQFNSVEILVEIPAVFYEVTVDASPWRSQIYEIFPRDITAVTPEGHLLSDSVYAFSFINSNWVSLDPRHYFLNKDQAVEEMQRRNKQYAEQGSTCGIVSSVGNSCNNESSRS